MTLERTLRASMLTLVGAGMASLALAVGSPAWLLVGPGLFVAYLVLAALRPGWVLRRGLTTIAVLATAQGFVAETLGTGTLLVPAGHFLIVVQLIWLTQERTSRHYAWLCLTALLQMVVSGVLSVDLAFGVGFLVFLPAAVLSLLLLNLRAELERSGSLAASELRSIRIGRRLLASVGLVVLGEMLLTVAVFLYFPRFGIQLFQLRPVRRGPALAGFSDRVHLGDMAEILDNPEVVMSVRLFRKSESFRASMFRLRWRGIGLDTYEDGTWSTRRYIEEAGHHSLRYRPFRPYVRPFPGEEIVQEVALEPVNSRVLFHLPRLLELDTGTPNLEGVFFHASSRTVSSLRSSAVSLRYIVRSRVPEWPIGELRRPVPFDPRGRREEWLRGLQLPTSITPRVGQFAEQIVANVDHDAFYDRARTVETYLKGRYDYSLRSGASPRGMDPVEDFLFRRRSGHCEHFAAAMAVLLRTLGIPSRVVTGFNGGEWNEYGRFYVIRQRNAHAWVEAYMPSIREWVSFDPTPMADPSQALGYGWLARLDRRVASLRLAWNNYVVNYSSQDQRSLADAVNHMLSRLSNAIPSFGADRFAFDSGSTSGVGNALAIGFGLLAAGALGFLVHRWVRRRPRRMAQPRAGVAFYRRMEAILRRRGFRRDPGATPLEFAHAVVAAGGPSYEPAEAVTEAFCRVRYGRRRLTHAERAEVARALHTLRTARRRRNGD